MNKTAKTLLLVLLAVILVGGGIFAGINWNRWFGREAAPASSADTSRAQVDTSAEEYTGDREVYQGEKNTDTIDIPGYGSISLKAGETGQAVNFYNPEQNTCCFRMSLLLSDGTELWKSGLVEPGMAVYEIELNQPLEAGEYEDATLKYECFAMDDEQTPLNGSEIKLTLNVLE